MTADQGEKWLEEVYRGVRREHPELVRRLGVTLLNVAVRGTPPNPGGHDRPGKKGVKALKTRISEEISGVGGKVPTAIPNADGAPVRIQGKLGWGGYGFIVPRADSKRVKLVDPASVLRSRVFRRTRNVVRGRAERFGEWNWVSRKALKSAQGEILKRAGGLIGSWLPSARALNASNANSDFNVSQQPRKGAALMRVTRNKVMLEMKSDWGNLIVGKRFLSSFDTYVRVAAYKAIQTTRRQFYKFLEKL